jgi:hypothetical protein
VPNVASINSFLQSELARREIDCVTAVEAARWLATAGLLRDSISRPGKPLRDLLRRGAFAGQRQELNSKWFICRAGRQSGGSIPEMQAAIPAARHDEPAIEALVAALRDPDQRVPAREWPGPFQHLRGLPGLYAWWVDDAGAADLMTGMQHPIGPGLIYAGQTGAGQSSATLGSRIGRNHISGNIRGSTFRWTIASVLQVALGLSTTGYRSLDLSSESILTRWIRDHLAVSAVGIADRSTILATEHEVLRELDPPLNLQGMPPTMLRLRLSQLRTALGRDR